MAQGNSIKGRGASHNPPNRFDRHHFEADPGQSTLPERRVATESARSIVSHNDSPDIPFSSSLNPYRGCEHGCVYCYARPTHEFLGLSAGLDFESRLTAKTNAAELLRKKLSAPTWVPETIFFSGITDCYQPIERDLSLTRSCLEVLVEFRNPVFIITKSALVTRDIDLLEKLAAFDAAAVMISITTLQSRLHQKMEPRASHPERRLQTIATLSKAGIPVGVMAAPMVPGLNDSELPAILEAAKSAGASFASYTVLRLPGPLVDIFDRWLQQHYPDRRKRVLTLVRGMRAGRLNTSTHFGVASGSNPQLAQLH